MKTWKEVEAATGIKIYLQDGTIRPVIEWLDDLYLNYTYEQASLIVQQILKNGLFLFEDVLEHKK